MLDILSIAAIKAMSGSGGGDTPTGTIDITENGTYDVTDKATAVVDVAEEDEFAKYKRAEFYGPDGTVIATYGADEFAELTEMPAIPDRTADGLTTVGWNYSLEEAQEFVSKYEAVNIGAMYRPTDGKTHIFINIQSDVPANYRKMGLNIAQTVAHGITVDWGDGSTPETYEQIAAEVREHTYTNVGQYDITLEVTDGELLIGDIGEAMFPVAYQVQFVEKVYIGDGVTRIGGEAFASCTHMREIIISPGVTSIGGSALRYCGGL